jgi:lipoprotein-anchoring transpeptidase ErfK/SrfK
MIPTGYFGGMTKKALDKYNELNKPKQLGRGIKSNPNQLGREIKSNPNIEKAYNEIVAGVKYFMGTDKTRILKAFDYIKNKQDFETLKSMFKDKRTGYGSFDEMVKEEYDMFDSNDIEKLKTKLNSIGVVFNFNFKGGDSSCISNKINANDWKGLYRELVKNKLIKNNDSLVVVWGSNQTLYYTTDGKTLSKSFKVSTGSKGFSNQSGNGETPTGLLQIKNKVKAKTYEVLVGKKPTGQILGPNVDSTRVDNTGNKHIAEVLTGLLDLDGLEDCNKNAFSRNIYFHGTNRENYLGTPRSNGCIRVSNNDILWMISSLPEGTKVYIKP